MNLHPVDAIVLVAYLIGITVPGAWAARRVRNTDDYLMPRRFGRWTVLMHAFGTGTASDQAVTVASATAKNGLSGIWFQRMWLFSTPFYWLIAPIMRRFRAVTTADVYELRYNKRVAMLFAIVGIAGMAGTSLETNNRRRSLGQCADRVCHLVAGDQAILCQLGRCAERCRFVAPRQRKRRRRGHR